MWPVNGSFFSSPMGLLHGPAAALPGEPGGFESNAAEMHQLRLGSLRGVNQMGKESGICHAIIKLK